MMGRPCLFPEGPGIGLNVRMRREHYEKLRQLAFARSREEERLVSISELVRDAIVRYYVDGPGDDVGVFEDNEAA